MEIVVVIALLVVVAVIAFKVWKVVRRGQIREAYQAALKGTDKAIALNLGRRYYALCHKDNSLTAADEVTIANDLAAMKT